jgi:hypothetical protein
LATRENATKNKTTNVPIQLMYQGFITRKAVDSTHSTIFFKDKDGTQCYGAQTYIKRLISNYETMFGNLPREYFSPMDKDDAPELDVSELCGPNGVNKFQSIIGALQWLVSLCRFDIQHAVMSMSRFRHAPRVGHLKRLERICGYLRKFNHGAIRFRTKIPNHEEVHGDQVIHDWAYSVYGKPTEEIPPNAPEPKGKPVRTSTYADANLLHDRITGRSCSGILHFLNQTPRDSFSKRQNQVETAIYGSEFMTGRQAVEQIIDILYTLRMFGVPIDGPSWLLGDNQSVVTSSTLPYSTLSKRWNALSYHRIREAIAAGIVRYEHVPGVDNVADILTKALAHAKARIFLDPLLIRRFRVCSCDEQQSPPLRSAGDTHSSRRKRRNVLFFVSSLSASRRIVA